MDAYCVKCRAGTEILKAEKVVTRNGKQAIKGVCAACGTTVYRIGQA